MPVPRCVTPKPQPTVVRNVYPTKPLNIYFYVYGIYGPIAGATVQAISYFDPVTNNFITLTSNLCNKSLGLSAQTDQNGIAELCFLSGTYIVQFSANGYNTIQQQFTFDKPDTFNIQMTAVPPTPLPTPISSTPTYIYVVLIPPASLAAL